MESELVQAINSITESINALAQPRFIDWLAVILSFFSVVLSGTAIWFAVQVPKKIADRQDKISLFEKRYHAYSSLLTIRTFSQTVNKDFFKPGVPDEHGNIWDASAKAGLCCLQFSTIFGYHPKLLKDKLNSEGISQTITILKKFEIDIYMLPFLFNFSDAENEEMTKEISEIFKPLLIFMTNVTTYNFREDCKIDDLNRQNFIDAIDKFFKKYADRFELQLKIK